MALLIPVAVVAAIILARWRHSEHRFKVYFMLGMTRLYARLWHGCHVDAYPPPPAEGPALIICNHTCSPDPTFVQATIGPLVAFLAAEEFGKNSRFVQWILKSTRAILVHRNKVDLRAVRQALRQLALGQVVCIFPEGNLRGAGTGQLQNAKCGAALLALRSKAPVYPLFISGGPQDHNLGRAWKRPARQKVRMTMGHPIDLSQYYDRPIRRPLLEEVNRYLMAHLEATNPKKSNRK